MWAPKYRKEILSGRPGERLKEIFGEIAEQYGMEIDTMEVMPDHVHLFLSFPPKYSISEAVKILKSWSARRMFEEFKWTGAQAVGRGDVGRRILCPDGGGQGDGGCHQAIPRIPEARRLFLSTRTLLTIRLLFKAPGLGPGFFT
ncbi:MAG: IS200/IS605 family transposase [Elusimicrobia bacterium]|nr:IS200/IS605 family transposase [Elusimicrobiota bacterium]